MEPEKYHVLIADDSSLDRQILNIYLSHKYRISESVNGLSAVTSAEGLQPDIIIMDLLIPDIGGLNIIQEFQDNRKTRHIPIIFVTILNQILIRNWYPELAEATIMNKPLNQSKLVQKIEELILPTTSASSFNTAQ